MNVLYLLNEIASGKPESGKVDALLSLKIRNPHTNEWIYFSEIEDRHLTEAYRWSAELSEYTFTPMPQQSHMVSPGSHPPVSSGYGGSIDLSKKYPPSTWKKAKRWFRRYGWVPAALAAAGITYGVTKYYQKEPDPQDVEKISKRLDVIFRNRNIKDAVKDVQRMSPEERSVLGAIINDVVKTVSGKQGDD